MARRSSGKGCRKRRQSLLHEGVPDGLNPSAVDDVHGLVHAAVVPVTPTNTKTFGFASHRLDESIATVRIGFVDGGKFAQVHTVAEFLGETPCALELSHDDRQTTRVFVGGQFVVSLEEIAHPRELQGVVDGDERRLRGARENDARRAVLGPPSRAHPGA